MTASARLPVRQHALTAPLPASTRVPSRWVLPPPCDPAVVARLRQDLQLPDALCRLLLTRGHALSDNAKRFLRPRLAQIEEAVPLLDLDRAVDRLARAIASRETILVHGDYDVDGICSTTLMIRTLLAAGGRAVPFIPRRLADGYDLTAAGVGAARAAGARVVVTCDCGTSAVDPIAELQQSGIDVIVTDHHLPGGPLPNAYAILNPRRPGCPSSDKDLAGAGVAYKLALALTRYLGMPDTLVQGMLDLVALATIADVAPLRGENRVLARYGLRMLNETRNTGLRAMIRAAGLAGKRITAGRVGFILAPRLNAVGRLGHALRGVELLLCESEHQANAIARELEELNERRQEMDRATLVEAREMVERLDLSETFGVVLAAEGWHPGVIGIVASRIVEEYHRPTILIAMDGREGKGSGRSISHFDLHRGLIECRDLLVRFGGHRVAAGVTIRSERLAEFAARFNAVARSSIEPDQLVPELRIDLEVGLHEANDDLERLSRHLEPCGAGNPTPVLVARGVTVGTPPRVVGKDGLRLTLRAGDVELGAIGWGMARRAAELHAGQVIDVAFRLDRDEWNGESRLQARLADFRAPA